MPHEVIVPTPIPELTTKRMLAMEHLIGLKLIKGMRAYYKRWARENGTTLKRMEAIARRKIEREGVPDRYEGSSA